MKRIILFLFTIVCCLFQVVFAVSSFRSPANSLIAYTDVGAGEPLVLIHAFPTDERLWEPQRAGLQKNFRVITLDLSGFGKAPPVDGEAVIMTDYADEVKQLLDQLHIKKAIIGGESMGGYVALAILEKYPDVVSGLILSDTQSIADSDEAKAKREATALDVLEHGSAQLISGFMPKALTPQASDQTRQYLQTILESQSSTAIASALRGMEERPDTSNLLSGTSLPVLIITGDQDALISSEQSQNMHQLAKNSKLVIISNAAHLSSLEQPAQWNQAVINMFYDAKTN